jgi:hypothetical protein
VTASEPSSIPSKRRPNMASSVGLQTPPKIPTLCHLPRHTNKMLSEKVSFKRLLLCDCVTSLRMMLSRLDYFNDANFHTETATGTDQ